MSVLNRVALEESPLADLHTIASELSIDGYRRLRREELIQAILGDREAEPESSADGSPEVAEPAPRRARRTRTPAAPAPAPAPEVEEEDAAEERKPAEEPSEDDQPGRRRRGRRGGRGRTAGRDEDETVTEETEDERPAPDAPADAGDDELIVEGVVDLLPNGSGFVRVHPPETSDEDVYISAAQVKRCELVPGDRVSGPRRSPRRSERFPSLIRVDAINGQPASEVAEGARFDDLPAAFPTERLRLDSEDPTVKAIEWLTPLGKGSRVAVVGASRAGKTEALRRLARALAGQPELQLSVALAGVRPEEIPEWEQEPVAPTAAVSFAASADAQAQAVERVIDQGRRVAVRGADAVVVVDCLDGLHPEAARKVLAAARNLVGSGSLTVIAAASRPLGGETTVIALDPILTGTLRFPALDLAASGTIRPELLVGEQAAEAIAQARREAVEGPPR